MYTQRIKVGLVDDQLLVRSGFKTLIESWDTMQVILESGDGFSVIEQLNGMDARPDVMLVDIRLPGKDGQSYSGIQLTQDLQRHYPSVYILIVSMQDDPVTIANLIECGAHGFLSKWCAPEELKGAIETVCHTGSYINEETLKALQNRLSMGTKVPMIKNEELTGREVDVIRLICQQLTAEEIGEKLFISPKTVNGHRNNLLQKTGSRNITGLVMYAVRTGLVEIV
ncbi:MAG: response regulator transcription factor [Sediminibacterium sp.]|nr:response regulator transcription factor [Sediminibacterium sp.]